MVTIKRLMAALWMVGASAGFPAGAQSPACAVPDASAEHPLLGRQERLAQFETLPETCLKTMVVECSTVASQQMLDAASAASCSMSYEALLKRSFNGNFQEMLAWWRSRPSGTQAN
jgi:hypothetical protein